MRYIVNDMCNLWYFREELSGFTKRLLALPYVERTNTHVVLTTVKEDFRII